MIKLGWVVSFILFTLALTSCAKDVSLYSTQKLCVDYLNAGPLASINGSHGARKAELDKRGVTNCGPYEAAAEAEKARQRGVSNPWDKLEKGLRNVQKNLPKCTRYSFSKNGVKQCHN